MKNLFLKPSDPLLAKVAEKVPKNQLHSSRIRKISELMLKIIQGEQKGYKKGVGLAAPQIGILKRIILVDVSANGKGKIGELCVYINPVITWSSKEETEWYEGCFSTSRVCGIVSRPKSIKVRAITIQPPKLKAEIVEKKYSGYVARIFQHEIDHLTGKLFVDLITNQNNLHWVKKSEFPLYRKGMAWKNWPKKCPRSKWDSIKNENKVY